MLGPLGFFYIVALFFMSKLSKSVKKHLNCEKNPNYEEGNNTNK